MISSRISYSLTTRPEYLEYRLIFKSFTLRSPSRCF
jgi:hypothetical protein